MSISFDDIAGEPVGVCRRDSAMDRFSPGGRQYFGGVSRHRHPSFPLVKPVRNIRLSLCITLACVGLLVSDAAAQSSNRSRSMRQSERAARASWQPIRTTRSNPEPRREIPTNLVRQSEASMDQAAQGRARAVRTVDHIEVKGVPVTPEPASVMEQPIIAEPLDGQVSLAPVGTACDALPPGQCGCEDPLCFGGCDGIGGCDACAGGSCGGCNSCCGELCSPEAWRPCVTLCLPQDGWISYEFLGWWQSGMKLPPLVTTSVDPNVPRTEAGVLTSPSTRVLFGGGDVLQDDAFDGGRLRFGVWLDKCHTWGVGAEFFQIGRESESFTGSSTGSPVLSRPFFNTQTGLDDAELVAFPDVLSGTVAAYADSKLVGGSFHFKYLRCCDEGCSRWLFCGCPEHYCSRTETMFGYRYLELEERVAITENLVSTDTANPGTFAIIDQFDTRNQFNGFDLGWLFRNTRGFWTFDTMLRIGIGNTKQTVTINGQTTINDPNENPQVQTLPGGLLTQTSNIGTYRQNEFTVVPEFNMNLGYQLTDHLRATLGYTFIYWSNVVRPGEHISLDLNTDLLPPPAEDVTGVLRPAFAFDTTDYWVQGINVGCEYRW